MSLSRRDFLKLAGVGYGAINLFPARNIFNPSNHFFTVKPEFPAGNNLGRLTASIDYRSAPRVDFPAIKKGYEDEVVQILHETVAGTKDFNFPRNQRWFETPDGFLFAGYVQPVKNIKNDVLTQIPAGKQGFWAEVTIPYVDMDLDNPPAKAPWTKDLLTTGRSPRLYYSQVVWIDQIKTGNNGQPLYRFNENAGRPEGVTGGSYGDIFWADGTAFHIITPEEITPINKDVDPKTKKIKVNLTYQTLSCFEDDKEVYFCHCSTGAKFDSAGNVVDNWSTALGDYKTGWKTLSIHMSGGASGAGYDTPAVSWCNFFDSQHGIAIHSAFWHNLFGEMVSHGCVNVAPEDAKWIFRWTSPQITLENPDLREVTGTEVVVEERII